MSEAYNGVNKNLYQILEINRTATPHNIKQSYKRLALLYHPDKNNSKNANEIFNHIKIAYDVLSNEELRKKYDSLNMIQHDELLNNIYNCVKTAIEPKLLQNILNYLFSSDTIIPNYDILKEQIDKRLQNTNELDGLLKYIKELHENKIKTSENIYNEELFFYKPNESHDIKEKNYNLITSIDEQSNYSDTHYVSSTISQGVNIYCEIKTTLEEIYKNELKNLLIKRQIIENNDITYKQFKYEIDLLDDRIIFNNNGDNYYDTYNNIRSGDLIIDIKCKQHQYFKRVNDYDILIHLPLTLCELFTGFNKTFDYFGNQKIKLKMDYPFGTMSSNMKIFKQLQFDGIKLKVVFSELGLIDPKINVRGKLIIYLVLIKKEGFYEKIKNI